MRIKKVFSNQQELAHVWAAQKQVDGRSSSMFFSGDIIYSYGYHYAIAKIHGDKVLINSKSYSNSTAKHTNYVIRAVNHKQVFYVPEVNSPSSKDNLTKLRNDIADKVSAVYTGRAVCSLEFDRIKAQVALYNKYCQTFDIKDSIELPEDFIDELTALIKVKSERYEALKKIKRAKREAWYRDTAAKRALEEAKRIKEYEDSLDDWKYGTGQVKGYGDVAHLRIVGNVVETSQHASVPLEAAKMLARIILESKEPPQVLTDRLAGMQIGDFEVREVTDENVIIGCHTIPLAEVRRLFAA